MTLGPIVQGERSTLEITWVFAGVDPASILGATITAVMRDNRTGVVTAVTGVLTATADDIVEWEPSEGDSGTAGGYDVFLQAVVAGVTTYTLVESLLIIENPAVTAVQNPLLVAISQTLATWLANLWAAITGTAAGQLVQADEDGLLTDSGIAAVAVEAALGTGGTIGQVWSNDGDDTASWQDAAGGGLSNIVEDTTPQLGGNLDLNGNVITGMEIGTDIQAYSAKTAAIAALTWAANSIIMLTGTATAAVQALAAHVVTFLGSATAADARTAIGAGTGDGDVTAAANINDHAIVRGADGAKGVQSSGVIVDDSNNVVTSGTLAVDADGNGTNDITIGRHTTLNNRGRITVPEYLYLTVGVTDIAVIVLTEANLGVSVTPSGTRTLGTTTKRWSGVYGTFYDMYANGGGHKTWAATAVAATPQTVIANGTGDVTLVLSGTFTVSDGAGNVAGGVITATAPSGTFDLYSDGGTNALQLQVAADGSVTVVRTAGSRTYACNLTLNWM